MLNIIVKINNVDKTSLVKFPSLSISDSINQRKDTCVFSIVKTPGQSFIPVVNDEVVVLDGATRIFGGVIIGTSLNAESVDYIEYQVECSDFSHFLDRKLVLERYENKTVNFIIDNLKTVYASTFTIVNVNCTINVASISFNRITLSEALQKLADATNYSWYVDYDKDIHFFAKNIELAPFNLSDTTNNYIWNSLELSENIDQLRNTVYVEGGEAEASERTETFIAPTNADERTVFRLANKYSKRPTVTVQGVSQLVGIDFLNADIDFDCMWSFGQKYIRFTAGNEPASADTILVTGIPLFPIIIRVLSPVSITQYGTYEFVIRDKSIRSREEAKARARAELRVYQNSIFEGGFKTYTSGLRSGQIITINSTIRGF